LGICTSEKATGKSFAIVGPIEIVEVEVRAQQMQTAGRNFAARPAYSIPSYFPNKVAECYPIFALPPSIGVISHPRRESDWACSLLPLQPSSLVWKLLCQASVANRHLQKGAGADRPTAKAKLRTRDDQSVRTEKPASLSHASPTKRTLERTKALLQAALRLWELKHRIKD